MDPSFVGIARLARSAPVLSEKRFAEYRQLAAYQLLNRCNSPRMPFRWTINPYRGCEFGCRYCYARYTHEFMELRDPEEFETKIFAKQWNPDTFRSALRKLHPREPIAIGTATDPYQPAERRFRVTRSILEVFATLRGRDLSITTKSDLVTRDLDLLSRIAGSNRLSVNMTVTTLDAGLARKLEPLAPRPDLRLAALRQLREAGIPAGVLCCPLMPLINDAEEDLDRLGRAVADAGGEWLFGNVLFLKQTPREVFLDFLDREFPHLAVRYRAWYRRSAYLEGEFEESISARIRHIRERHGLAKPRVEYQPPEDQLALAF